MNGIKDSGTFRSEGSAKRDDNSIGGDRYTTASSGTTERSFERQARCLCMKEDITFGVAIYILVSYCL